MNDQKNSDLARNAGFGTNNQSTPAAVGVEREAMPARTPHTDSDRNDPPPVRMGPAAEATEKPTEGDPDHINPIHHTGHIPPPVTSNHE